MNKDIFSQTRVRPKMRRCLSRMPTTHIIPTKFINEDAYPLQLDFTTPIKQSSTQPASPRFKPQNSPNKPTDKKIQNLSQFGNDELPLGKIRCSEFVQPYRTPTKTINYQTRIKIDKETHFSPNSMQRPSVYVRHKILCEMQAEEKRKLAALREKKEEDIMKLLNQEKKQKIEYMKEKNEERMKRVEEINEKQRQESLLREINFKKNELESQKKYYSLQQQKVNRSHSQLTNIGVHIVPIIF